ncbi:Lrp/AsnC family transcriptional regulator [Cognatishimia activa]|uniref:Leucine-responsive regulatory protein n=1 Tax=Cognatishimia activa TaxID=1715691 RepID=A0A0P1ITZ9_9RHOB|nr:Lrp/AsnC family transcriptional regulator [Cognatishimia activa]CUJ33043.1 Leucine-responsive regulatory protein [Cognatishimia activa]CUK27125.1 Leucine-responsive regulatory protein [Cognatishimia activa]
MVKETDNLRQNPPRERPLDALDRKILGALARDASVSYAELGKDVGLSAPAVHERVKRLRRAGAIEKTMAQLNGAAVGKHFLAFVHVESSGWGKTKEVFELGELPEVEEIHSITGDSSLILKVRVENAQAMEGFLWRLYHKTGVRGTHTYVVLNTHMERGVQAEITHELTEGEHVK